MYFSFGLSDTKLNLTSLSCIGYFNTVVLNSKSGPSKINKHILVALETPFILFLGLRGPPVEKRCSYILIAPTLISWDRLFILTN